jgi:hypothetical protein
MALQRVLLNAIAEWNLGHADTAKRILADLPDAVWVQDPDSAEPLFWLILAKLSYWHHNTNETTRDLVVVARRAKKAADAPDCKAQVRAHAVYIWAMATVRAIMNEWIVANTLRQQAPEILLHLDRCIEEVRGCVRLSKDLSVRDLQNARQRLLEELEESTKSRKRREQVEATTPPCPTLVWTNPDQGVHHAPEQNAAEQPQTKPPAQGRPQLRLVVSND